jgi:hypothetical protein
MTDQEESNLAVYAAQVLENPAFKDAMSRMKESCDQAIRECPMRDFEGLQLLVQASRITASVERVLTGILEAGKAADARIDVKNARSESRIQQLKNRFS